VGWRQPSSPIRLICHVDAFATWPRVASWWHQHCSRGSDCQREPDHLVGLHATHPRPQPISTLAGNRPEKGVGLASFVRRCAQAVADENPAQVSASARSTSTDSANAHTASMAVIASAHQYVATTVRVHTSSATPCVEPSNTAGRQPRPRQRSARGWVRPGSRGRCCPATERSGRRCRPACGPAAVRDSAALAARTPPDHAELAGANTKSAGSYVDEPRAALARIRKLLHLGPRSARYFAVWDR
jgi:hypothetical protein